MELTIGVAAFQGAFIEHEDALSSALRAEGLSGRVVEVRTREDLDACDALVIPGGESTTISKLLARFGVWSRLKERAESEDLPVLGTCAGMILLASEGDEQVARTETPLLGLLDISVDRNAFGRQRESFERPVSVSLPGLEKPFQAVFIRAPAGRRAWGACEVLGTLEDSIIACRQGNRLGLAFHPELTPDLRIHRHFVRLVADWKRSRATGGAGDSRAASRPPPGASKQRLKAAPA